MEPDELPPFDDEPFDDSTDERSSHRSRVRLARLGRRLLDRGGELGKGVLETSDRAKSEMVRMVAREVRNYLDELGLKDDLLGLATSHSLEVSVSLSLKPLAEAVSGPSVSSDLLQDPKTAEVPISQPLDDEHRVAED